MKKICKICKKKIRGYFHYMVVGFEVCSDICLLKLFNKESKGKDGTV